MKLHNYQERGRRFIHANNTAILAVGMGLGKTATTIHAILEYEEDENFI